MGVEIERKFLVRDESFKGAAFGKERLIQGYLSRDPERTVRVRVKGDAGFITVKGKNEGAARLEFEYEIGREDALEMLRLALPGVIDKTRYYVEHEGMVWEVDEYHNLGRRLVTAEVEMPSVGTEVGLPQFVGEEVTGNPDYYNSNLQVEAGG